MFCENCGKTLKENDQFCEHCGLEIITDNNIWPKEKTKIFKKITLILLSIIIIASIAGAIGYKLFYKKVEGVQDVNSKIINRPKESETNNNKTTDKQKDKNSVSNQPTLDNNILFKTKDSIDSYLNQPTSTPIINPYKLNLDSTAPNYIDTYNDFLIKQAELDYENSHKEFVEYTQNCSEMSRQRNEALAPINTQLDQLQQEMDKFESDLANRTDLTQAQKDRVRAVEGEPFQQRFINLTTEWLNIYNQYSC